MIKFRLANQHLLDSIRSIKNLVQAEMDTKSMHLLRVIQYNNDEIFNT